MTEPLSRTSALAGRHTALGSGLEDWNGMGTAWEYSSDPNDEHDAIREAAGLFDMSPLKKVHVRGADATTVVDHVATRDLTTIYPGQIRLRRGSDRDRDRRRRCDRVQHGRRPLALRPRLGGQHGAAPGVRGGKKRVDRARRRPPRPGSAGTESRWISSTPIPRPIWPRSRTSITSTPSCSGTPCTLSRTGYSGERGYEIFTGADSASAPSGTRILDGGEPTWA